MAAVAVVAVVAVIVNRTGNVIGIVRDPMIGTSLLDGTTAALESSAVAINPRPSQERLGAESILPPAFYVETNAEGLSLN